MTFVRTMLIVSALGGGSLGVTACNRTPEQAHEDGVEAQREANAEIRDNKQEARQTITEAQQEANKKMAEANQDAKQAVDDANKKIADTQQATREDNAQAQAKANVDIRKANLEVNAEKGELHAWAQKQIDEVNNAIDSARVKAEKATPKAQANFDAAMKSVQAKRDVLASEVASIEQDGARKTDDFKAHIDAEVTRLKNRIETVAKSL